MLLTTQYLEEADELADRIVIIDNARLLPTEPPGRERWTMQMLADKLIELAIVETISDETVRTTLKKMC